MAATLFFQPLHQLGVDTAATAMYLLIIGVESVVLVVEALFTHMMARGEEVEQEPQIKDTLVMPVKVVAIIPSITDGVVAVVAQAKQVLVV